MKKWLSLSCMTVIAFLVLGLSACGGGTASTPTAPAPSIAKVRIWLTLSNNPDAPSVTTLTPEQTAKASIWARGTTEESVTFKLNLVYGDKFTTLATNVRTEGASKAVAVGGLAAPLEPGNYTFQAISGAFGGVVGSLQVAVVSSLPSAPSLASSEQPTSSAAPSSAPSEQPALSAPSSGLSEQSDVAVFQKYFSELGIGKMPTEVKNPPLDLKKNVNVFSAGDQICLYGTLIQECQIRNAIYDVAAQKVVRAGGLPKPMIGGFAGWEPIDLPAGKYEYKVYVGDALVGVFPFEVR
jgi:hypothetical protein